jgi:hypothetical protein
MPYEKLLREADGQAIEVYEKTMPLGINGLYSDSVIWINKALSTGTEKGCILAEEHGHYHTTSGDILDQSTLPNHKQENRARNWAYEKLVPSIVQAHKSSIRNRHELAAFLNITEDCLRYAITRYIDKYGLCVT